MLGSNGAGKTTLFNAVTGDFPPTSGRIRFFGEDVTAFPVHEQIRPRPAPDLPDPDQLFGSLSVIDSIFVACRGVSRGRLSLLRPADRDATMAQARSIAHSVHLDDILETPVSVLSHGQQRQLEIALALSGAPRFILFDEPRRRQPFSGGAARSRRGSSMRCLRISGYIVIEPRSRRRACASPPM